MQSSEAKPYDKTAGPALMELQLNETIAGDIDGESLVRALQVVRDDHSASVVSVQRFHGKLGGRAEWQDHGDMVRRSRMTPLGAARYPERTTATSTAPGVSPTVG